jgi:hypothetical protein
VQSDQRIQWAILTNGQVWRLYYQKAKSRAEEFLELDLQQILGLPAHRFRVVQEFTGTDRGSSDSIKFLVITGSEVQRSTFPYLRAK